MSDQYIPRGDDNEVATILRNSNRIIVITGAGISTSAGLPVSFPLSLLNLLSR